jgi:MSHA biogenesis protein MshK
MTAMPWLSNPRRREGVVLALLACGVHAAALAQPLADPTRPGPGTAAAAVDGGAPRPAGEAAPKTWPQLQSVRISAPGEASAVIDGRLVRKGDHVGDAVVVTIEARSVVLRTTHYTQQIGLTPGVVKTASTGAAMPVVQPALALATKDRP